MSIASSMLTINDIKQQQRIALGLEKDVPWDQYMRSVGSALGINETGIVGSMDFGLSPTVDLPVGMSPLIGTYTKGHDNYGNYQYSDGSIMVWIPTFYYRWTTPILLEILPKRAFKYHSDAHDVGFTIHRAFWDGGSVKDGFFVDKYQCSNNGGIASSIKNANPLTVSATTNPISGLNNAPVNNLAGTIDAAKTRGPRFFPTTIFIQKSLSYLAYAHSFSGKGSATTVAYGVGNDVRGNTNGALKDVNDTTVTFTPSVTGSLIALTGSGVPFNKTTHNGQNSGVADINGNLNEVALGITKYLNNYYLMMTVRYAHLLTSGNTVATDAWGQQGVLKNYKDVGTAYETLNSTVSVRYHSRLTTVHNFSLGLSETNWGFDGAGVATTNGTNTAVTGRFGNDSILAGGFSDMVVTVGGAYDIGTQSGIWHINYRNSRTTSAPQFGFRLALYPEPWDIMSLFYNGRKGILLDFLNPDYWYSDAAGTTLATTGANIKLVKDSSGNNINASISVISPATTTACVIEAGMRDGKITVTLPERYQGTMVTSTLDGILVTDVDIPAGSFTWYSINTLYYVTRNILITKDRLTDDEKDKVVNEFIARGGKNDFGKLTILSSRWTDCTYLTSFPLINSAKTGNCHSSWKNCSGLTSFPLLDLSKCTILYHTWYGCTGLTSFPLITPIAGQFFINTWNGCTSLANFPANMFDKVKSGNFTNAFTNTALTQVSIDNILTSLVTSGVSTYTRVFNQSGGSAPSVIGTNAITTLRSRGWTVTVTGGF